jgi:Fur family ferric uptake transcriptional regulator
VESHDLKKAGLKVTLPRIRILEILERADSHHLSADEVYKCLLDNGEDVGLATVYRVLNQFESAGLVTKHHFAGGHSVYELDRGDHHDHMRCMKCGQVNEFYDEAIEQRQRAIAKKAGWQLIDHSLYLYGLCPQCQEQEAKNQN